jgi:hypothetical protein
MSRLVLSCLLMNKPKNIKSLKVYSFCIKKTTTVLKWVGIYATKIKTGHRRWAMGYRLFFSFIASGLLPLAYFLWFLTSFPGSRTLRTGQEAFRTTFSAVLPKRT